MADRVRRLVGQSPTRLGLALFCLLVVAYLPALANGFVWDDINDILLSDRLRSWAALGEVFRNPAMWAADLNVGPVATYRPLSLGSFVIDYQIFGLNAWGYHLSSILWHGLAQLAVFLLLRRWVPAGAAFVLALIGGLHPVTTEAVVWINGRSEVFALLFGALALLVASRGSPSWGRGVAVGCLLLLSALGKETGLVFIPLAVAVPYLPCGSSPGSRVGESVELAGVEEHVRRGKEVFRGVPNLAMGLVVGGLYFQMRRWAVGFELAVPRFELWEALTVLPSVTLKALQAIAIPLDRSVVPMSHWLQGLAGWERGLYGIAFGLLVALWGVLLIRRRWLALFGLSWWLASLMLLPLIVVMKWPGLHRWLYIGLPGLGLAIYRLAGHRLRAGVVRNGVVIALIGGSLFLTERNIPVWRDQISLFHAMVEEWPEDPYAFQSLAVAYLHADRNREAEEALRIAIELGPWSSRAHWLLGAALARQGHCEEGVRAVYSHPEVVSQPEMTSVRDLGECYLGRGQHDSAERFFRLCAERITRCQQAISQLEAMEEESGPGGGGGLVPEGSGSLVNP
ncbi:MAG: hypothetical protein JW797_11230 [Bradymonadales bacterium]|nr:hypothetical protein [Bradymonadales bacterium]